MEKTEVSKEETGSSCPICLKGYEAGEAISSLPCKHSFHVNCLLPWLQVNLCKPLAHSVNVLYVVFISTFMFTKRAFVLYVVLSWTIMLRKRLQVLYVVLNWKITLWKRLLVLYVVLNWTIMLRKRLLVLYVDWLIMFRKRPLVLYVNWLIMFRKRPLVLYAGLIYRPLILTGRRWKGRRRERRIEKLISRLFMTPCLVKL